MSDKTGERAILAMSLPGNAMARLTWPTPAAVPINIAPSKTFVICGTTRAGRQALGPGLLPAAIRSLSEVAPPPLVRRTRRTPIAASGGTPRLELETVYGVTASDRIPAPTPLSL